MTNFKLHLIGRAVVTLIGGGAIVLAASGLAQAQNLGTVTITGSSIKRSVESQQALPVTVLSAEDLKASGVTSTEQIIQRISASQPATQGSQSIGSGTGGAAYANLRGLGATKTLVLLNGRRLAFFGFSSSTIDLNAIPFAALERVEVLRDGASAIYGTDAVGGVINFITKSSYGGFDVSVERDMPRASGGGDSNRVTFSGGRGDLQKDGYNFWFSLDRKTQTSLRALDRPFAATGIIPEIGLFATSGTSFPGNFLYYKPGDVNPTGSGNLTKPGCVPPLSVDLYPTTTTCRFDYPGAIDIIPETENTNVNARGSFKLGADRVLTLEAVQSQNTNIARVAPDPVTGLTMPITSPYFPATFPGIDPTRGLLGIGWRMVPGGQRENTSVAKASRFVAELSGVAGAWDYRAGVYTAKSDVNEAFTNGYVSKPKIQTGINDGLLNPFGTNTAAGLDYIESVKAKGVATVGQGTVRGVDARLNRDLFKLDGGNAAISLGLESRREGYSIDTDDALVRAVPSAGRAPYHVTDKSRTVSALSVESLLPVTKALELTLAARSDRYSDFGTTTNPKAGFRFTASPAVVFRGSANSGFMAPSLDTLYGPQSLSFTSGAYDDPVLCPNGVPAAGGIASRDCQQQYQALSGGNPDLKPEKSKALTFGTAIQASKDLLFTVDYWNIELTDKLMSFPEQTAVLDSNRLIRCNTAAGAAYDAERCKVVPGSNAVAYVVTLTDNLGGTKTSGIDLSASWGRNLGDMGRFSLTYDGTLVRSYKYQREAGGEFVENVGKYVDGGPVFRWKHNIGASLATASGRFSAGVRNLAGYEDAYDGRKVPSYSLFDVGYMFTGVKNMELGIVVRNLFDKKPPLTNQEETFQVGYDPRYTDPLGRTLGLRFKYKF